MATVYGPVVADAKSEWFVGAKQGTNQTGELCGVLNALLWLEEFGEDGDVAICVDSLYAGNEIEGCWAANANVDLITYGQEVLKRVRQTRSVTFIHVKGHSSDVGNDRADELVQWGKSDGPFTRLGRGISEGPGLTGPVMDGPVRANAEQPPGAAADGADDDMLEELLADLPADFLEWDDEEEDQTPPECRVRDPKADRRQSVLDALLDMSSEEEEEDDEKMEAQRRIEEVTEQIAIGDRKDREDRIETIEETMQLERITIAASRMSVTEVQSTVADLVPRLQQCWISTIGYRYPAPRKIIVCNEYRSFVISVQGGSSGPKPNK